MEIHLVGASMHLIDYLDYKDVFAIKRKLEIAIKWGN